MVTNYIYIIGITLKLIFFPVAWTMEDSQIHPNDQSKSIQMYRVKNGNDSQESIYRMLSFNSVDAHIVATLLSVTSSDCDVSIRMFSYESYNHIFATSCHKGLTVTQK